MPVVQNTSHLTITIGEDQVTIDSNVAELAIIEPGIVKTVNPSWTMFGGTATFCNAITNPSDTETITNSLFSDTLDSSLSYVDGTFTVDGVTETPTISGQTVSYVIPTLAPGQTINICFRVLAA